MRSFVPSNTMVAGQFAIRPCYINPRTRLEDVDGLIDAVLRLGANEAASRGRASSGSD
jgi:hypothetical protein